MNYIEVFAMNYDTFITEIKKYWDLRSKGLKKQANGALFQFTEYFKKNVSQSDADGILFRFCTEYIDELKFPGDNLPRRHLPFQLSELLNDYLVRASEENKMLQMRWFFQIFGNRYNPHDRKMEHDPYCILERAYMHEQCDQQTVDLYFNAQIDFLWWGQHHFPEGCIIAREAYEKTVQTADKILSEKTVDPSLVDAYKYYVNLYQIYYDWHDTGRNGDFGELCEAAGINFKAVPAYYYTSK